MTNAGKPEPEACLSWEALTLQLRTPFRLSYGATQERTAHWIRLRGDAGWGEGTIPPYYPVLPEAMRAYWERTALRAEPFPERMEDIFAWVDPDGPAPARAAVDLALLRVRSFGVTILTGTLFRVGAGAVPFLLPLSLQLVFVGYLKWGTKKVNGIIFLKNIKANRIVFIFIFY